MSLLLFSNNAQTTLAGPIAATATSVNLAAGTGSEFPSPTAGQYFVMTFNDQATKLLHEIVWVTARNGDTLTIVRAQEGTTALAWLANDIAANWWTAGQAAAMIQVAQLQLQATNYAQDVGSVNALSIGLVPAVPSLAAIIGAPIRFLVANTNTGSATLSINSLGATVISNPDGRNVNPGQLIAGHIYEVVYNGTTFDLMSSPYQLLARTNTWSGVNTFTASPLIPTPGVGDNSTKSANTAYVTTAVAAETSRAVAAEATKAAVAGSATQVFNVANGSAPSQAVAYGQFNISAAAGQSSFSCPGLIIKTGSLDAGNAQPTTVTFTTPFPNNILGVYVSEGNAVGSWGADIPTAYGPTSISLGGFAVYGLKWNGSEWISSGGTACNWLAIGY